MKFNQVRGELINVDYGREKVGVDESFLLSLFSFFVSSSKNCISFSSEFRFGR